MSVQAVSQEQTAAGAHGLSATALKYIAIAAMLVDHIAWSFLPKELALAQAMHLVGRIVAPIMCYFVAEGYFQSRDRGRYARRLLLLAVVSHVPFNFHLDGTLNPWQLHTSVIYPLLLGLLLLWGWQATHSRFLRVALAAFACALSLPGDWSYAAVLWVLVFGLYRGSFRMQALAFAAVALVWLLPVIVGVLSGRYLSAYQLGVLLALPLLRHYNGRRGAGGAFNKWVFYVFYPLHLMLLGWLSFVIFADTRLG